MEQAELFLKENGEFAHFGIYIRANGDFTYIGYLPLFSLH